MVSSTMTPAFSPPQLPTASDGGAAGWETGAPHAIATPTAIAAAVAARPGWNLTRAAPYLSSMLLLLALVLLACVALIPLGLPGTWIMLAAALGYNFLPGQGQVGTGWLTAGLALALVAEVLEFTVAARYTTRYGGSRRAGWGAILGGFAGAI